MEAACWQLARDAMLTPRLARGSVPRVQKQRQEQESWFRGTNQVREIY
jgi:hypothetical protein